MTPGKCETSSKFEAAPPVTIKAEGERGEREGKREIYIYFRIGGLPTCLLALCLVLVATDLHIVTTGTRRSPT